MPDILKGKKILVTSGPTREYIDPVRYLSNASSGKQGAAIADALVKYGADVTVVSGPAEVVYPTGAKIIRVESAQEMLDACLQSLPVDIAVCAAAVCDWRPKVISVHKIKKQDEVDEMTLTVIKNPDILAMLSQHPQRPKLVIGFAAETENLIENARKKLLEKQCDWIVANNVATEVFGRDTNTVHIITKDGVDRWPTLSKQEIGVRLTQRIGKLI